MEAAGKPTTKAGAAAPPGGPLQPGSMSRQQRPRGTAAVQRPGRDGRSLPPGRPTWTAAQREAA
eukprot:9348892-Lingulodinium_polyedra.AAC.1